MIQMYATAEFGFDQGDNGWLMSEFAFMRSLFLIFMFPPIISAGRKWFRSRSPEKVASIGEPDDAPAIPTSPQQFEAPAGPQAEQEPVQLKPSNERQSCAFDLFFLRWSLVVDGALTTIAAYATQGWHIYLGKLYPNLFLGQGKVVLFYFQPSNVCLAAFLLPFGSGSAPAAKGVITEMCPSSQRADALNAITLVENVARLATTGFFGFVFASLADIGKAYMTFYCNAVSHNFLP